MLAEKENEVMELKEELEKEQPDSLATSTYFFKFKYFVIAVLI